MWSKGDVVAVREVWHARVWKARPWIVARDTPELLVLWIPKGARTMLPEVKPVLPTGNWRLREGRFGTNALRLTRPGAAHSILLFFGDDFEGWYVNLERPLRRFSAGIDCDDLFLDLFVEPDGRHRWLDEDELAQAVTAGLLTPEDAVSAREEGERVLTEWPFPTGWEDFRPDPRWEPPRLPAGWDVV